MLSAEVKTRRLAFFNTFLVRFNGCGLWLALISLPLALIWLWFGDFIRLAFPADERTIQTIISHIVLTTFIVFVASWVIGRFYAWKREARNSLNSGC